MTDVRRVYSHPLWGFIGIVATIAALGFALWWHFRPDTKALSYSTSIVPVVADIPGKPSELHIMYGATEVADVHSVQVYVRNTGDVPISPRDFDGPLTVQVTHARILSVQRGSTIPPRLPVQADMQGDSSRVLVHPILLNPGDQFSVSLIVAGKAPSVAVDGRIMAISAIGFSPDLFGERAPSGLDVLAILFISTLGVAASAVLTWYIGYFRGQSAALREELASMRAGESHVRYSKLL